MTTHNTHNQFYDAYEVDPREVPLNTADAVIEDVEVIRTGVRIAGFEKKTNPAEIARWHDQGIAGYDPDQQRGWRIKYGPDGQEEGRNYLIKRDKVKAIAQRIAENKEYNRFRTVNARLGHVGLYFEPYPNSETRGRLYLFRDPDAMAELKPLLTIPDSAHRQYGDKHFVEQIAGKGLFSPAHAGFSPETYDLILHITLIDEQGEGEAHYEHNELITKSSATRRSFLEGGQTEPENWVVHEVMRLDPTFGELVEVYEKSISTNSPKLVTFSTLSKGVEESWGEELKSGKEEAARQIGVALRMAREEVPEWGPMPFTKRKEERETKLYSQAIVLRALLRVLADLHRMNEAKGQVGDWAQWRPVLRKLSSVPFELEVELEGRKIGFRGEFLSRDNPLYYANPGASIYQMNKTARLEKEQLGEAFVLDPKRHLTVQNTRLTLDMMYGHLSKFLGYRTAALVVEAAE